MERWQAIATIFPLHWGLERYRYL